MSNLDMKKLEAIFWGDQREQPTRVRLARVIAALRDELTSVSRLRDVQRLFEEILASEGGQAAGGPTSNDGHSSEAGVVLAAESAATTPAAPAPVCEWVSLWRSSDYSTPHGARNLVCLWPDAERCPSCGLRISFTEAQR